MKLGSTVANTILYCNSSATARGHLKQDRSGEIDNLGEEAAYVATSTVTFAESLMAFVRNSRQGMPSKVGY